MGQQANVPIEPPEQERLLDACADLPGVLGGGVPGGWPSFLSADAEISS